MLPCGGLAYQMVFATKQTNVIASNALVDAIDPPAPNVEAEDPTWICCPAPCTTFQDPCIPCIATVSPTAEVTGRVNATAPALFDP